ncbi:MAG: iron ABC transporter permease [Usitatibacteraceae bacterium]
MKFTLSSLTRRSPGMLGAIVALLFLVPLLSVGSSVLVADQGAWTHISHTILPGLAANSVLLALGVAIGVSSVGTGAAWLTTNYEFPGRRLLEWTLILPLAMPAYVMAYAYTDVLQYAGPLQGLLRETFGWEAKSDYWFPEIRSLGGAVVMLTLALYPYVYVLARVAFLEQSNTLTEAARNMGLSPRSLFLRVSLPLARPAIAAGVALALMETLADYGTVSYFGVQTFTTGIFNAWFSQGDRIAAARLAVILLGFVVLIMLLEHWARRRARFHQTVGQRRVRPRLRRGKSWLTTFLCALPIAVGFAIPTLILLKLALTEGDVQFGARFIRLSVNSFGVASITAFIAVSTALALAYVARSSGLRIQAWLNRLVGLGYAVPGTVIAVGVLIPLIALDHFLADTISSLFAVKTGLLLTGGFIALIYAYLIRFLAVALQSVEAGMSKITPSMDDAARSLGSTPMQVMLELHMPLLRTSLITAGLLVFVDVMKELPATLVMRPFNFDTLAVQTYNLAMDERLAEASTAALVIVAVGLIPLIVASRAITKSTRADVPQLSPLAARPLPT